jgi:hypothetical protein
MSMTYRCVWQSVVNIICDFLDLVSAQEHGFRLTGLHKDIVKKELHKHDIFLSSDDDILFTAWQLREFIDLSSRLQSLQASEEYYPGFFVYEIDTNSDSMDFVQWKHTHGLKVCYVATTSAIVHCD